MATVDLNNPLPFSIEVLDDVALNATEALRTGQVNFGRFKPRFASIHARLTRDSATTFVATCYETIDGTNWLQVQSRNIADGTGTISDFADSKSVSGDDELNLNYELSPGISGFRVVLSGASGGASDLASATIGLSR
jgi:hypothetical protein